MSSLDESVTKTKQWPAWAGSDTDFRRLLRLMEKHVAPLIPKHVEQETAHERSLIQYPADRLKVLEIEATKAASDGHPTLYDEEIARVRAEHEMLNARLERAEAKALGAGRIELSLTGKDEDRRKVTGTADELSEYLDGRYIQELEITAPSGFIKGYMIDARAGRDSGLYVRVSSKDANWALSAASEIHSEASRQLPTWRVLRSPFLLFSLYALGIGSVVYFLFDEIARRTTVTGKFAEPAATITFMAFVFISLAGASAATTWTRKYVPAFEIVHAGGRSRGRALIAIIGSTLAALVLGVAGNGISNALFSSGGPG